MNYFMGREEILTNSFNEKFEDEDKKELTSKQLRNLIGNEIYCPKCGAENYFEESGEETETDYFCKDCKVKLNVYWKAYLDGFMQIKQCEACKGLTFKDQKYCISCGLTKAVIERLDEIESGKYKPKRHKWFITIEVDALDRACFYPSGKRRIINPHHPKARRNRILFYSCITILILSFIAFGIMIIIYPIYFCNW